MPNPQDLNQTQIDAFLAQFRRDPAGFLNDHIVTCPNNPPLQPANNVVRASLELNDVNPTAGCTGYAWSLCFVAQDQPGVDVYWCPYVADSVGAAMLGDDAQYMFTVTMNACSFGVGAPSSGQPSIVRVAHANAGSAISGKVIEARGMAGALKQQAAVQQHFLYSEDSTQRIVSYLNYMQGPDLTYDSKNKATTFGVHARNAAWSFFVLKYRVGWTLEHRGVHPV